MKKIILTIAGMFAIGVSVNAQSDSTYKLESTKSTYSQTQSQSHPYKVSNREAVQSSDVPESLRQTLSDERYAGWENSTVYRDKVSNEYYFDMANGDSSTQYRFDKNGKSIQDGSTYKSQHKSNTSKSTHVTTTKKHSSQKSSQAK